MGLKSLPLEGGGQVGVRLLKQTKAFLAEYAEFLYWTAGYAKKSLGWALCKVI